MYYGYHRVSTAGQNDERGVTGIKEFCYSRGYNLQKIFVDKVSGKIIERPRYTVLKEDVLRKGDTLIIYELDRLARTKKMIINELRYFEEKGIRVMILDIPSTTIDFANQNDTMNQLITETINHVIIEIYAMQAETEVQRKEKRQREGIEAKRRSSSWGEYGRQRVVDLNYFAKQYKKVEAGEIGSLELMRKLKMKKSTFYKYRKEYLDKFND